MLFLNYYIKLWKNTTWSLEFIMVALFHVRCPRLPREPQGPNCTNLQTDRYLLCWVFINKIDTSDRDLLGNQYSWSPEVSLKAALLRTLWCKRVRCYKAEAGCCGCYRVPTRTQPVEAKCQSPVANIKTELKWQQIKGNRTVTWPKTQRFMITLYFRPKALTKLY